MWKRNSNNNRYRPTLNIQLLLHLKELNSFAHSKRLAIDSMNKQMKLAHHMNTWNENQPMQNALLDIEAQTYHSFIYSFIYLL